MKPALALLLFLGACFAQDRGNCTRQQVSDCVAAADRLPLCADGVRPTFSIRSCCYDCKLGTVIPPDPTGCTVDLETIRLCAPNEVPVRLNGCPSCRIPNGVPDSPNCTRADFQACEALIPTLPTCSDDIPLQRVDCCISCKPVTPSPCNRTQIAACEASYPRLRECATGESPAFDRATCCRTCRRPPPSIPDRPDGQGRCTREQFLRCLSTLDTCKPGERPFRNETNHCCPSCKRPESVCARESVVACMRNLRPCATGEVPSRVPGECCATCLPPRPTCNPTCAATEVCVDHRRVGKPTCVGTKRLIYSIVSTFNPEDLRTLIREIVQRFCERNENRRVCAQFGDSPEDLDDLLFAIVVAINNTKKEASVPDLASLRKRQLLASFSNLVEAALADPIANGGFQFVTDGTVESSVDTGSSAVALTASLLFAIILAFF